MKLFVLFVFLILQEIDSAKIGGQLDECYGKECPENTNLCKRHTYLTQDKKFLKTEITCLDINDTELQKFESAAENPYGNQLLNFESYTFYGSYSMSTNGGNDSTQLLTSDTKSV